MSSEIGIGHSKTKIMINAFQANLIPLSPTPNHDRYAVPAVKREGLADWDFPFPSLRGEGAGVRGKPRDLLKDYSCQGVRSTQKSP
jgi:hypothetical protein